MENACLQCTERCHETHRVWSDHTMRACPLCISNCNLNNRVPFFFKYVTACMESTYCEPAMEIPQHFAKKYISDSVCHVEIEGPDNTLWYVKLRYRDNQYLLQLGWSHFAESTDITRGDALLFKLLPIKSTVRFNVKIFKRDPTSFLVPKTLPLQALDHHHKDDLQTSKYRRVSHQQMLCKSSDHFSRNPLVTNVKQKNVVEDAEMRSIFHPPMTKTKEKDSHSLNGCANCGGHGMTVRRDNCTEMITAKPVLNGDCKKSNFVKENSTEVVTAKPGLNGDCKQPNIMKANCTEVVTTKPSFNGDFKQSNIMKESCIEMVRPKSGLNGDGKQSTIIKENYADMVTSKSRLNNIDSNQRGKETNKCTDIVDHNKNQSKSNIRTESWLKDMDEIGMVNPGPCLNHAAVSINMMSDKKLDVAEETQLCVDAIESASKLKNIDYNKKEVHPKKASSSSTKDETEPSFSFRIRKRSTTDRELKENEGDGKPVMRSIRKASIVAMDKISGYMRGSHGVYHCHKQDSTLDNQNHKQVTKLAMYGCIDRASGCNSKAIDTENVCFEEVTSLLKPATNVDQEDNFKPSTSCQLPKMQQGTEKKTRENQYPIFYKAMCASSVNGPCTLSIPKAFADKYMKIVSKTFHLLMTFADGQKTWLVSCRVTKSGIPIVNTLGWRSFVVSNQIKEHDICVFRLVENFKFNVEIMPRQNSSSSHIINARSVKIKDEK